MIRIAAVSLGLVVIAANLPRRTDRLGLVVIALSVFVVGAIGAIGDRMRGASWR